MPQWCVVDWVSVRYLLYWGGVGVLAVVGVDDSGDDALSVLYDDGAVDVKAYVADESSAA